RGVPVAVCDKTYRLYNRDPYSAQIIPVPPLIDIPLEEAGLFDCMRSVARHPKETKGEDYVATTDASASVCGPEGCC
ncbi:MAG: methyltransferase, partial [Alphaproteobacteria bacterium]|nr:methyltransferase [Alphaproteobacteria bacterium]